MLKLDIGIFNNLQNEFMGTIEFLDNSNTIVNEGQISDISNFETYTLNKQNLPILIIAIETLFTQIFPPLAYN